MRAARYLIGLGGLVLGLSSQLVSAQAESETNTAAAQARFLQQLVHFVNWHSLPQLATDADTRAQFCFLGALNAATAGSASTAADSEVYSWFREQTTLANIDLHRFTEPMALQSHWRGQYCHVIFGTYDALQQWPLTLLQDYAKRTLVLSDDLRFIEQGGMGSLSFENRRVRLYINRNMLNQSDISLRSRLMQVTRFYPDEE